VTPTAWVTRWIGWPAPHIVLWGAVAVIVQRATPHACSGLCSLAAGTIDWVTLWSGLAVSALIAALQIAAVLVRLSRPSDPRPVLQRDVA